MKEGRVPRFVAVTTAAGLLVAACGPATSGSRPPSSELIPGQTTTVSGFRGRATFTYYDKQIDVGKRPNGQLTVLNQPFPGMQVESTSKNQTSFDLPGKNGTVFVCTVSEPASVGNQTTATAACNGWVPGEPVPPEIKIPSQPQPAQSEPPSKDVPRLTPGRYCGPASPKPFVVANGAFTVVQGTQVRFGKEQPFGHDHILAPGVYAPVEMTVSPNQNYATGIYRSQSQTFNINANANRTCVAVTDGI